MTEGILPNGASHLLLPSSRFEALGRAKPRCRSHPLDKFSSLSPIHFANLAELQKKLKFHASTKSQKKVAEKDQCDRSKANQSFATAGDGPSDAGRARSSFELQRYDTIAHLLSSIHNSTQSSPSFPPNASRDRQTGYRACFTAAPRARERCVVVLQRMDSRYSNVRTEES